MASTFHIKTNSVDDLKAKFAMLSNEGATSLSKTVVGAGISVFSRAVKAASKGSIKREVGGFIRNAGDKVSGRAGLLQFPERGVKGRQPHGIFLEAGTKYITPRRFVSGALSSATGPAMNAMQKVGRAKLAKLAEAK